MFTCRLPMRLLVIMALAMMLMISACEGPRSFKIKGELKDRANTNLYVKYYGNGAVQTGVTAASDGKFEAVFPSKDPTIVELLDNEYRVLGRLFLKNGDDVFIEVDRNNPYNNKITGDKVNEQWSAVLNENADLLAKGDRKEINSLVESFIAQNPDNMVSTLMFVSLYDSSFDPLRADSVLSSIAQDVRLASLLDSYHSQIQRYVNINSYSAVKPIHYRLTDSDSVLTFNTGSKNASLIAVSNENSRRSDSILPHLKRIYNDYPESELQILDLALFSDTSSWKNVIRRDSAKWIQGWLPGGILGADLDVLAIPMIPYYIVTDSAGIQLYRGNRADSAQSAISKIISPKDKTKKK